MWYLIVITALGLIIVVLVIYVIRLRRQLRQAEYLDNPTNEEFLSYIRRQTHTTSMRHMHMHRMQKRYPGLNRGKSNKPPTKE